MKTGNDAASIVNEYNRKQILRKLGYTFNGDEMSVFKAECFTIIGSEFAKCESEAMKKAKNKRGRR